MKRVFLFILLPICILLANTAWAAPKKDLWPRWLVTNPLSTKTIDYSTWASFLKKYVHTDSNGINLVAYDKVSVADKKSLSQFLVNMSIIKIDRYNRKEQEAFWINLYNALTVEVVLQHFPEKSILDIKTSGMLTSGPWKSKLIKVEGTPLSLNDIEHRILRPIWNDQRIHYAVNCAAISCPNLRKTPYSAKALDQQLNTAAKQYVNSKRGTDIVNGQLIVSSIYTWYEKDFGGTDIDVIHWLEIYANPKLKEELHRIHTISRNHYDWKLNLYHG